jgi:lysophospholipase L1-like esterase
MRSPRVVLASLLLAACGSSATSPTAAAAGDGPAVLFVGNSLTESNNLPGRVRALAAAGGLSLHVEAVVRGGASLGDHWAEGRVQRTIASRRWSFVVLQQGPSTLAASRADLIASAQQYAAAARAAGGQPALLMVWPLPGQTQEAVAASYRAAAEAVGGVLIPAGEEWVRARERDPSLVLTVSDGFHPSAEGTEIAARTTVCTLFPSNCPR